MNNEPTARVEGANVHDVYAAASVDQSIDAVLAALRGAEPRPGLEARLLQRLAEAPQPPRRSWLRQPFAWIAVPALAVCVVAVVGLHRWNPQTGTVSHSTAPNAAQKTPRDAAFPSAVLTPRPSLPRATQASLDRSWKTRSEEVPYAASFNAARLHDATLRSGEHSPALQASNRVDETGSAHQPSFPAPEMPLTEQEELLLRIAHRNDPVQTAMLDPRERSIALARERAEVTRFFKPPPLPEDLQREIDAAVRKQYVPPPPTYPDTTPDRSLP